MILLEPLYKPECSTSLPRIHSPSLHFISPRRALTTTPLPSGASGEQSIMPVPISSPSKRDGQGQGESAERKDENRHVACADSAEQEQEIPTCGSGREESVDFEAAIERAGVGCFSYGVLLTAGLVFFTSGLQNGVNAYILPAAKCDFDLTSAQMGVLNAVFLAGGVTSSYVWGVLGDALGRRQVILFALVADAVSTVLSTLSQSYGVFAVFRFLSGAFIGGPSSIVFLYVGEFVPQRVRTIYVLIVGGFWTVSWIALPGIAWLVLPQPWSTSAMGMTFNSWRVFLAMLAAPSVVAACLVARLPETPQFLIAQGRLQRAMDVLGDIYAANTGSDSSLYPVKSLARRSAGPAGPADGELPVEADTSADIKSVLRVARQMAREALTLFQPPVLQRTAIICCIFFANMFSFYGLVLWLPELFNRFEVHYLLHPNQTMTVCQLSRAWEGELRELRESKMGSTDSSIRCSPAEAVNETVFMETLIISGVCLVACVLSALVANRVGRRTLPFLLNVSAGAMAAAIYFVDSTAGNLAVSSLFQALIGIGNTAINGLAVDIFPPRVSALGVCSAVLSGRLGAAVSNLVLGALLDVSCEVPIFLIAITVIAGGILCAFVQPPYVEENGATEDPFSLPTISSIEFGLGKDRANHPF